MSDTNKTRSGLDVFGLLLFAGGTFVAVTVVMWLLADDKSTLDGLSAALASALSRTFGGWAALLLGLAASLLGGALFISAASAPLKHVVGIVGLVFGTSMLTAGMSEGAGGAVGRAIVIAIPPPGGMILGLVLGALTVIATVWVVWLPSRSNFSKKTGESGRILAASRQEQWDGVSAAEAAALAPSPIPAEQQAIRPVQEPSSSGAGVRGQESDGRRTLQGASRAASVQQGTTETTSAEERAGAHLVADEKDVGRERGVVAREEPQALQSEARPLTPEVRRDVIRLAEVGGPVEPPAWERGEEAEVLPEIEGEMLEVDTAEGESAEEPVAVEATEEEDADLLEAEDEAELEEEDELEEEEEAELEEEEEGEFEEGEEDELEEEEEAEYEEEDEELDEEEDGELEEEEEELEEEEEAEAEPEEAQEEEAEVVAATGPKAPAWEQSSLFNEIDAETAERTEGEDLFAGLEEAPLEAAEEVEAEAEELEEGELDEEEEAEYEDEDEEEGELEEDEEAELEEDEEEEEGELEEDEEAELEEEEAEAEEAELPEEPEVIIEPQPAPAAAASEPAAAGDLEDMVVFEAGCLFLDRGRVAVSMLQREFGMDFKQATAVLDALQEQGLIGPYLGGRHRDILMSREEWERKAPSRK